MCCPLSSICSIYRDIVSACGTSDKAAQGVDEPAELRSGLFLLVAVRCGGGVTRKIRSSGSGGQLTVFPSNGGGGGGGAGAGGRVIRLAVRGVVRCIVSWRLARRPQLQRYAIGRSR